MATKEERLREGREIQKQLLADDMPENYEKFIRSIPLEKITGLGDKDLAFWQISHPGWKNGESQRIRLHFKRAKYLAMTDYVVSWDKDQVVDKKQFGPPGSQRAFVFGAKRDYSDVMEEV